MLRKWFTNRLVEPSTSPARSAFRRRLSGRGLILSFLCLATAYAESGLAQSPQFFAPDPLPLAPAYPVFVAYGVESMEPGIVGEKLHGSEPPASEGYVAQASYADTVAQNAASATPRTDAALAELHKRLADVEAQLKKRDAADKKAADKKAAEEFPSHKITGFTQLDTGFFSQDPRNIATVGDMQNGTGFRRARLAVTGKVREFTAYQIEVDFATAGRPSFFDVWVEQSNLPWVQSVTIGQFCQPFSVDALTGFRNLTFLERSLPFLAMVPFRRVGVQSANVSEDEMTQWSYSIFRTGGFSNTPMGDDRFATDIGDVGGVSFSARATHLLQYEEGVDDRYLWHVGGGYNFGLLGANDAIGSGTPGNTGSPRPFYQARTGPEFGVLGYPEFPSTFGPGGAANGTPAFVDTGRYLADYFQLFGVETVFQHGPWGIQAEYMGTVVQSAVGPIFYNGAYGQLAYRLTGENRAYDKKKAVLTKLVPYTDFFSFRDGIRGWGAWEVAARYSFVDLRNPASLNGNYYVSATNTFNGTSSQGNGMLQDVTLGLTWFWNVHTKLQFNWIHAMLDNTTTGNSTADLFVSRIQVDY